MKKLFTSLCSMLLCVTAMAQSTDVFYPIGAWQNDTDTETLTLYITRLTEGNQGCGAITIDGTKGTTYEGTLSFSGKSLNNDNTPMGHYRFDIHTKRGSDGSIIVQKYMEGEDIRLKVAEVKGSLVNHPLMKAPLQSINFSNGANYDPTPYATSGKELLDMLRDGIENGFAIKGFGPLRQYINTHAKLDLSKPIYAKPKGTGSVNIRESADTKAQKIGELAVRQTLPVTNEYNGWCQVKLNDGRYGYISLSVVALTNTPASNASTSQSATQSDTYTARGELGLFDLHGPVKECVWTDQFQTRKLGFDRNGMWVLQDGRKPWDSYGPVKRDNKGRIIQMGYEEESGELFTYNANGLMTKHVTIYMDGRDVATYTYNSKGECIKEVFGYGDSGGRGKNTATFTILSRDNQGNWTKRKTQNGNVETRTITYYE